MKKPQGSMKDFLSGDYSDKVFVFRSLNINNNPSFIDSKGNPVRYPATHYIDAISHINWKDPKDGRVKQRVARLMQGENSIFKDEQPAENVIKYVKVKLLFNNGRKIVDGTERQTIEYMMIDNQNGSNPNRKKDVTAIYELVDNVKVIESTMANDMIKSEAIHFAYKGDLDEVTAYARVLNVNLNQKVEEIRWDMKRIAEMNPSKFMDGLNNPTTKIKACVLKAIDEEFLILNGNNNSISWKNNPFNPLDMAVQGKDVVDNFVNKLSTDAGKPILEAIIDMITPQEISTTEMIIPTKYEIQAMKAEKAAQPMLAAINESDSEIMDMINSAVQKGIIIEIGKMPWLKFDNKKFQKRSGMLSNLKGDKELLDSLKKSLIQSNS